MNEPNPLPFPAVMNAAALEKGLAIWRGVYPTYRAAMEVLTRDSANLTDIASKDDGAEVLLTLAESLDGPGRCRARTPTTVRAQLPVEIANQGPAPRRAATPETTMHASIAHAIYRGEKRQFASRMEAADARLMRTTYRFGRKPWLRTAVEGLFRSPHFVTVQYSHWGEKKHEVAAMMGYLHPESLQHHDAWCASSYVFRAKNCTYERRDLPIKVSHHAVLRLMERADIANPAQALFWTVPAMQYALLAEDGPPDESVLLPCAAGAMVAVRDKDEPEDWAFVTYLDDVKLRPEQRAEVADRLRQLKEKLGATGESRVLHGQRGGRAFLA